MNAIPWYRSPVLISAVTAILSQALVLFGITDAFAPADIEKGVNAFFELVSFAAAFWTLIARLRSKVQPVTLTKAGAQKQGGFGSVLLLIAIALGAAVLLTACTTTPAKVIQTGCAQDASFDVKRCAKTIGETYEIYQKRVTELVTDPTTPAEVKARLQKFEREATPAVVEVLRSARTFDRIYGEVIAGATEAEQLEIANQNLQRYIAEALPRLYALIDAFGG